MDLIKQYLIQSLTAAANNLRLTTHQLESLGLLKECIFNSKDLQRDISKMKTVTELSTLGIRLHDIFNYLSNDRIDFFKISEKFKSHSQYVINDLTHILEIDNPELIKNSINKVSCYSNNSGETNPGNNHVKKDSDIINYNSKIHFADERQGESEEENGGIFSNYENLILKPIKPIDTMLKKLVKNEVNYEDLSRYAKLMKMNGEISEKNGFEILSQMHNVLCRTLLLIRSRDLMPGKEVIESMRACLIVIVAVVKGKDVDIANYLKKAEGFEKKINAVKIMV